MAERERNVITNIDGTQNTPPNFTMKSKSRLREQIRGKNRDRGRGGGMRRRMRKWRRSRIGKSSPRSIITNEQQ